jgi:hypothetical protein
MKNTIPILMYHQVTSNIHPQFKPSSVTPKAFPTYENLKIQSNTINLNELEDYRSGKSIPLKNPIVITFIIVIRNRYNAVPVLKITVTAIFFIPTDFGGKVAFF